MYVFTIHDISDPDVFWAGKLNLPKGTEQSVAWPSVDGKRGVCVFKSDSIDTVRDIVYGATRTVSTNEFYELNDGSALGLPA